MSAETAAIARRAAEIVQERGHCKGNFSDPEGRVCLWGALRAAVTDRNGTEHTFAGADRIRDQLHLMFPSTPFESWPGANFNDRADTTEQDVAKVLLQLADRLELAP